MRYFFIFFILFNHSSMFGQSNIRPWEIISTDEKSKANLKAVSFASKNVAYAVGNNGIILRLTKGGWNEFQITNVYSKATENLNDIVFNENNGGYIAGDNGTIFYTDDGGLTWNQMILDDEFTTSDYVSIACYEKKIIYVATRGGKLLNSNDGGVSWKIINYGSDKKCQEVNINDEGTVFINCNSTETNTSFIYERKMGEQKFSKIYESNVGSLIKKIGFKNRRLNTFLTNDNLVGIKMKYLDNIMEKSLSKFPTKLNVIAKNSKDRFFIFGDSNIIFNFDINKFYNIEEWKYGELKDTKAPNFFAAEFDKADTGLGYAVGENGMIWATFDNGESWINPNNYIDQANIIFKSIKFLSNDTLIAVGNAVKNNSTQAIYTIIINDGTQWVGDRISEVNEINSLAISPNKTIVAVGSGGAILKSSSGGPVKLKKINFESGNSLMDVKNISENKWLAVGENSTVIISNNNGDTWQKININESISLTGIWCFNKNKWMICGQSNNDKKGVIYETDNGGANWTRCYNSSSPVLISKIYFINEQIGFAALDGGVIMKTNDGGKIWNEAYTLTESKINEIRFENNKAGYAVCDNGVILETTDGGNLWNIMSTKLSSNLNCISISSDNVKIFAAGNNGTILKY